MAEEFKVEEAPKDLPALEPIVLTGKETPEELKTKLADIDKQRVDERTAHQASIVARRQIHARAVTAETKVKDLKPAEIVVPTPPAASTVDVDERILISQGLHPDLLKELKDIAAFKKISLIDAQKQPLYLSFKENFDKKNKSEQASVRGAKGSGERKVDLKDDPSEPGISREEHQRRVKLMQEN